MNIQHPIRGAVALYAVQEPLHHPAVFQNNGFNILGFIYEAVIVFPVLFVEIPDPDGHFRVKPFLAAGRHIGTGMSPVGDDALQPAKKAERTAKIQVDHRVAFL